MRIFLVIIIIFGFSSGVFAQPDIQDSPPVTPTAPRPGLIPFDEMLGNVQDRTETKQDMAYNWLIKYVSGLTPEAISRQVKKNVKYKDLMAHPEKYRGEFVRAEGKLMFLSVYNLDTNPAGVKLYYSGLIIHPETEEYYRFNLIDRPVGFETRVKSRNADWVIIEGAFLKIDKYARDPRYGYGDDYAPFLIGRRIIKVEPEKPDPFSLFTIVGGGVVLLIFVVIFVAAILSNKKDKQFQAKLAELRKKRKEAKS